MALTAKREKFAQECANGATATDAYRTAFNADRINERSLWSRASALKNHVEVAARIAEIKGTVVAKVTYDMAYIKDLVLRDAIEVVEADPSELVTYRRLNCRHCHGMNFAYRWRDEAEYWAALAEASDAQAVWDDKDPKDRPRKRPVLPTDEGGYGFKRIAPPMPGCPKCEGEGLEEARVADVRTLSGPARRLYAGVEVKKDGSIKVHMRDKEAARALLGKYAGVLVDKVQHTGVVGLAPLNLTETEKTAIRLALEKDI